MMRKVDRVRGLWAMLFASLGAATTASAAGTATTQLAAPPPAAAAVGVLFDTDMYSDIDDMLALAMLHALQDRDEIRLLGVTISTEADWIAPYVDLVDTFYGHGDIPVGMARGGVSAKTFTEGAYGGPHAYSPNGVNYTQHLAQLTNSDGSFVYPHRLTDGTRSEEAVHLLRRVLAAQPDQSVVLIEVGYTTNLARLLQSKGDAPGDPDGIELVRHKVRFLSMMGGSYVGAQQGGQTKEFNISMDVSAARTVFERWPTPIVASGWEIGVNLKFPLTSIESQFNYVARHPIAETYRYVAPYYTQEYHDRSGRHDHPTWDLTAVLYGTRPTGGYFTLSKPGVITVTPDGVTRFRPQAGGAHRYLKPTTPAQKARELEAMTLLVSQPPVHRR